MRKVTRLGIGIVILAASLLGWRLGATAEPSVAVEPRVRMSGGTAEQIDLGRWAVRRFEDAGLEAPPADIRFHEDGSGCGGHIAFARAGRVDVCTTLANAMTRRILLHELGHTWLDANVDESLRERFLELRELRAWNATGDPWQLRGYEQAAEVLAWGLGERILTPAMPDNAPPAIAVAYELLTGTAMPVW
jgi:hypothetical protein